MVQYIGLLAGILTSASLLPQVYKVYTTKLTRDISFWWTLLLTIGIYLWLIYGFTIHDVPLIVANASGAIFSSAVLVGKSIYK